MFHSVTPGVILVLVSGAILSISSFETNKPEPTGYHRFKRQFEDGGVCVLPQQLEHGRHRTSEKRCPPQNTTPACMMLAGAFVPKNWPLYHSCESGYVLNPGNTVSVCFKGKWTPMLPVCNKLCPPLRSPGVNVTCTYINTKVSCDRPMKPGTVATQECLRYYHTAYEPESTTLKCLDSGAWDFPLSFCTPDEICKQQRDIVWTCKILSQCPTAQEDLKQGVRPNTCYFKGSDAYVCCKPESSEPEAETEEPGSNSGNPPEDRISIQMCKKYAESVFLSIKVGDKEEKIDTCRAFEPLRVSVPKDAHSFSSNALPAEFPHMAVLGYGKKNIKWALCMGSLISERFVISVAHCAQEGKGIMADWVRLGDYDIYSNEDDAEKDAQSVEYEIIERIIHPEYNSKRRGLPYYDIALFKLKENVKFNEFVRPICLQTEQQFNSLRSGVNIYGINSGWGRNEYGGKQVNILQKINQTIIDYKDCNDLYKSKGALENGVMDSSMVCGGGVDYSCTAGGSPLQVRLVEPYCMYSLVGLVSTGVKCGEGSPDIDTRVSHFVPWIESIVWP